MTAVQPDLPTRHERGERAILQALHTGRPGRGPGPLENGVLRNSGGIAEQLHRHRGKCRIGSLMFPYKSDMIRHGIDKMRLELVKRGAFQRCFSRNHLIANLALDRAQHRAAGPDDTRLLACDLADVRAEKCLVIKVHWRDHAERRVLDHIGRVVAPA